MKNKSTYLKLDGFEAGTLHQILLRMSNQSGMQQLMNIPAEHLPADVVKLRTLMLKVEKAACYTKGKNKERSDYHEDPIPSR